MRTTLSIVALLASGCGPQSSSPTVALGDLMGGGEGEGYARAIAPREFDFPRDHGSHPEFRTEWWYVTGNLADAEDRPFGFHLTLFRRGLRQLGPRTSELAPSDLWMAHFAIADGEQGQVHAHERTARGAAGLAGATVDAETFGVWLEDWTIEGRSDLGRDQLPRLRLRAAEDGDELELDLSALKPLVLQGDAGLSVKGSGEGNASYYYAIPRMAASGTVTVDGRPYTVEGSAWLDREWSTSVLGDGQVGWDWFALQLDDGSDVMLYQMRLEDGSVDGTSHGSFTTADGEHRKLDHGSYAIESTATWRSTRSGGEYPSRWNIAVPGEGLQLEVEPLFEDQELPFAVVYWEGAVRVRGTKGGAPVAGRGFVELTGYADTLSPR